MIKLAVYLFISKPFTAVVLCSSEVPVKGTCEEYFLICSMLVIWMDTKQKQCYSSHFSSSV